MATDENDQSEESESFWFDECLPDVKQNSWHDLAARNPVLANKTGLQEIWDLIRGECLGQQDDGQARRLADKKYASWKQEDFTDLIAKAHRDYCSLFFRDFEQQRETLNHKSLENDFIWKMGNARKDIKSADAPRVRFENVFTTWQYMQNPSSILAGDRLAQVRAVNESRKNWLRIKQQITSFLDQEPEKWGLKLSPKGKEIRDRILNGQSSCCFQVDEFLRGFEDLANADDDKRMATLGAFADAIDSLHLALHDIRHEESGQEIFGGHFDYLA